MDNISYPSLFLIVIAFYHPPIAQEQKVIVNKGTLLFVIVEDEAQDFRWKRTDILFILLIQCIT